MSKPKYFKFGQSQREYKFTFKAQVAFESLSGLSLDRALANVGMRTVLSQAVFVMVQACDPSVDMEEVYELLDVQAGEKGGLDAIQEAIIEEMMVALGNPQADIKNYVRAIKLERAKGKRDISQFMAKRIKDLEAEEAKEPPGPGETLKPSE